MAISTFFIHRRSVDQVLDRLIKLRRIKKPSTTTAATSTSSRLRCYSLEEEDEDEDDLMENSEEEDEMEYGSEVEDTVERIMLEDSSEQCGYSISCSLPNAVVINNWFGDAVDPSRRSEVDCIPPSLQPLRTAPPPDDILLISDGENGSISYSGSMKRMAYVGRIAAVTPRSPVGNTYGSLGDSEDEGTEFANEDDVLAGDGNMEFSADFNGGKYWSLCSDM
ncbi:hypothetical protein LINGRAHAP2_LOCUS34979 [Linum grandiflorum]